MTSIHFSVSVGSLERDPTFHGHRFRKVGRHFSGVSFRLGQKKRPTNRAGRFKNEKLLKLVNSRKTKLQWQLIKK